MGITMYSLVYGRMRDVEVAAITITQTIEEVFLVIFQGISAASAVVLEVTSVWCVGIPLAVLGGLVLKLPIYVVYAMVFLEEVYRFVLSFIRYRKKKWLRNIIERE